MELSSLEANQQGHQRKVVMAAVRPAKAAHGDSGISLEGNKTLPFVVTRAWNAPAGHYLESWYLVEPTTREVLYEAPQREILVWGLLSWTEFTDRVTDQIPLEPGTYLIVFALGGVMGGQLEVEASVGA